MSSLTLTQPLVTIKLIKESKTLVLGTVTLAPGGGGGGGLVVRAATTANITLSGLQTIDGVALVAGDRVLVKNQTLGQQNGVYLVAAGAWTRPADADSDVELRPAILVAVAEGTTQADTVWILTTNGPIVVGTTPLTFTSFGVTTGQNLGTGADVFKQNSGSTMEFRTLVAGVGIEIDENTDELVIRKAETFDWKESVRAATTGEITLSGLQTIDGVVLAAGDRVLVKSQSSAPETNGIYVAAVGAWVRAIDADTSAEVTPGLVVAVEEGTTGAETAWILVTNSPIVLGTTALTFATFGGGTGGTLLTVTDLTYPVDYNLVGAAVIPSGVTFTKQSEIDGYLLDAGTTHFKHIMDCWDASPRLLAHHLTMNLAIGVHRARPGQTSQVAPLNDKISLGGTVSLLGSPPSTWDTAVGGGPHTITAIAAAPNPTLTFAGTPFTGLDLRGLHVVLSTGQVAMIHDHDNSNLFVTANLSPNPVGGTATIARPSTIVRNSQNDIAGQFISGVFNLGMSGPGGYFFQDIRVDTFSQASSCWAWLFGDDNVAVSVNRCLNDYSIQASQFGRPTDGRTFQNSNESGILSVTLFGLKTAANGVNELLFASGRGRYFFTDVVAYNPATGSIGLNVNTSPGSRVQLNKFVIDWITPAPDGAIDLYDCHVSFFDGFGAGKFCEVRRSPNGLVLKGGSRVNRDRTDIALVFKNTTLAGAKFNERSEWDARINDANHGLKNGGGNTGVGIEVVGPFAHVNLNAGTNVTGTVGDFRYAGVVDTYANLVANGPYNDENYNFLDKA